MSVNSPRKLFALPENTHTIAMGAADLNGIMRGKRIPASHWQTVCEDGMALSLVIYAMDMTSDIWDSPYVNMENGYRDMHMFPLTEPVASPWEPGVAICMGYTEDTTDHGPVPIDPRGVLVEQIERAANLGIEVQLGAELEFYLLDPETMLPKDTGIQVYSLSRAAEYEHVLGPMRRYLNEMGIPIEQSNTEYAAGQIEINIRYGEALKTADRAVLFRTMIKEIALHHGYHATFMSKPFAEHSGSGFHAHYSLWKDGKNIFSDNGKLSQSGLSFLAGLQKRMAECALLVATTPNAYKRRTAYSFCPVNTTWGIDNRTVGLRVIDGSDHAVRIEKRDGSADCNPYYLVAADIAAGLDGLEQEMQPSEMTDCDAYALEDADPIPDNIHDAIALAKDSDFLRNLMGEDRLCILIQQAEREIGFISASVTAVEVERYMSNL